MNWKSTLAAAAALPDPVGAMFERRESLPPRPSYSKPLRAACDTCGKFSDLYMLHWEVWKKVHPSGTDGFLCLFCAQEALGRPFEMTDFSSALANLPILIGYQMGRIKCD